MPTNHIDDSRIVESFYVLNHSTRIINDALLELSTSIFVEDVHISSCLIIPVVCAFLDYHRLQLIHH